jgi:hypothetical protein
LSAAPEQAIDNMTDHFEKIASQHSAGCAQPLRRRYLWAQVLGAALLALIVACGEVKLIEQSAAAGAACGPGGQQGFMRVVDNSLTSGLAPLANLR